MALTFLFLSLLPYLLPLVVTGKVGNSVTVMTVRNLVANDNSIIDKLAQLLNVVSKFVLEHPSWTTFKIALLAKLVNESTTDPFQQETIIPSTNTSQDD
jgi:hypothetical protein